MLLLLQTLQSRSNKVQLPFFVPTCKRDKNYQHENTTPKIRSHWWLFAGSTPFLCCTRYMSYEVSWRFVDHFWIKRIGCYKQKYTVDRESTGNLIVGPLKNEKFYATRDGTEVIHSQILGPMMAKIIILNYSRDIKRSSSYCPETGKNFRHYVMSIAQYLKVQLKWNAELLCAMAGN